MSQIDEYDRLILDLARDRHDYEIGRQRSLRDRAYGFLQVNLVVVGAFVTIIAYLLDKKASTGSPPPLLLIGIGSLVLSTLILMVALIPNRQKIFDVESFETHNGDKPLDQRMDIMIGTIYSSIRQFKSYNNIIANLLLVSVAMNHSYQGLIGNEEPRCVRSHYHGE